MADENAGTIVDQISVEPPSDISPPNGKLYRSLRFQVAFVLIASVGASATALLLFRSVAAFNDPVIWGSLGFLVAVAIVSAAAVNRLYTLPGVLSSAYIAPVSASCAGLVLLLHLLFRLPYSNLVYLAGFPAMLGALYSVNSLRARRARYLYCLVPGGRITRLRDLPNFRHALLKTPDLPARTPSVIVADLHHDLGFEWERFLAEAAINGVPVYHYKQVWEQRTGKVRIDHLSENSFGSLVPTFLYLRVKRLIDTFAALAVLPFLLPIFMVVSLLIKLESPGPIFFRQQRMGYRGRPFTMIKFRTMHVLNGPETAETQQTADGDPRITRFGQSLRKWRMDELPQVVNILRGEMSWIGPRPEAIELSRQYEKEIPFYRYRHIVRPGITGWAQVNQGHVTSVDDVNTKLQLDFYYIKYFSYWIDLLITFRTLRVMALGLGAR